MYEDCIKYLNPICQHGTLRLKDNVSQSYSYLKESLNLGFDKEDKKRSTPFIMMLNIEEIECIYYIVAVTSELPKILQQKLGRKTYAPTLINTTINKYLSSYEKQIFHGPPESNKDIVLSLAGLLIDGLWKKASDLILGVKLFNHHSNIEEIREIIVRYIKTTSLKCYLINYSNEYNSFDFKNLCTKFDLDEALAKRIVNTVRIKI